MAIVNGYATLSQFKNFVRLDTEDTEFDETIEAAVNAASRGIDKFCLRSFYLVSGETRFFTPQTMVALWLGAYNDLVSVSELATDPTGDGSFGTVWGASDFQLYPLNASSGPEPRPHTEARAAGDLFFPRVASGVRITGDWGWSAIPDTIHYGTLLQANRFFKRRESPESTIGFNMFGTVTMGRIDGDVKELVKRYRKRLVG